MFEKDFFTTEGAGKSQRKHREMPDLQRLNEVTNAIIGAAIEVHKKLGLGLLGSAYQECLAREFVLRNINFEKEKPLRVEYKGVRLECGYCLDFLVEGCVVVEIKSIEAIAPISRSAAFNVFKLGRLETRIASKL